jgi:multiple sugar transport system substrate-binding protein
MPLDITAEATEQWLTLLVSAGGTILDASGKPTFNVAGSPGFQAAEFLHSLYSEGLVDPGSVNLTGKQSIEQFAAGTAAFDLRSGPGILSFETDPKTSKVANDNVVGFLAGPTGPGAGVFGLPESLGIPSNAPHKCQAAMFLAWWNETPQEVFRYSMPSGSSFPAQSAAITQVLASGKPSTAQDITKVLPNIKPLFLAGAPTWYPEFANDVATVMQQITIGGKSVQDGLDSLAKQTTALAAKN